MCDTTFMSFKSSFRCIYYKRQWRTMDNRNVFFFHKTIIIINFITWLMFRLKKQNYIDFWCGYLIVCLFHVKQFFFLCNYSYRLMIGMVAWEIFIHFWGKMTKCYPLLNNCHVLFIYVFTIILKSFTLRSS